MVEQARFKISYNNIVIGLYSDLHDRELERRSALEVAYLKCLPLDYQFRTGEESVITRLIKQDIDPYQFINLSKGEINQIFRAQASRRSASALKNLIREMTGRSRRIL